MKKGLLSIWLAVIMVAGVFSALTAIAQEGEPASSEGPFACGELYTDAADDVDEENLDLLKGGIAATDDSSFTAEIQVKNLTTELPTDATGLVWYFLWTYADVTYFANATYSLYTDEVTYNLGTLGDTFTTTDSTEGTFTEGEGGTITVVVPHEAVGSPASGDALTQTYADTRIRLSGPAGPGLVAPVDRAPDGDGYGSDITVGACASKSPVDDEVVKEPKKLTKKDCKQIKNKKKRRACLKKVKQQNQEPVVEGCAPYEPGEQGAEAELATVTDEHTEEAPLEATIEHDVGLTSLCCVQGQGYDEASHVPLNLQVDSEAAEAGLYIRYEFPDHEDGDLYVNYADGSEAAHVAGGNQTAGLEETGTGTGGHSEVGAEVLDGLRTADCGGYTLDLVNWLGEGGEYTVKFWLGEVQNDPAPPEEDGGRRPLLR